MKPFGRCAPLAAALLLLACKSESGPDLGISPADRAADRPADRGASADATPAPRQVALSLISAVSTPSSYTVNALFSVSAEGPGSARVESVGACTLSISVDWSWSGPRPSAGLIHVTANVDVTLTPAADGSYAVASGSVPLWKAGQPVRFSAAGAEVPAFEETLVGPAQVTVTEPSLTGAITIPRDQPFTVKWSGGEGGKVLVAFSTNQTGAPSQLTQLLCPFDAAAGQATIPAVALQRLPAGTGLVVVTGEDRRTLRPSEKAELRLLARSALVSGQAIFK